MVSQYTETKLASSLQLYWTQPPFVVTARTHTLPQHMVYMHKTSAHTHQCMQGLIQDFEVGGGKKKKRR